MILVKWSQRMIYAQKWSGLWTHPGFPKRSMRTGEYLYPLRPDPNDTPEPDAALADFRNVAHSETWGVPNSTKKRGTGFRAPLRVHVDKRIMRARRSIKKKAPGVKNTVKARKALRTSSFSVRERAASTDSKQAVTTRTLLQVMDDEPAWDGEIHEVLGVLLINLIFFLFLHDISFFSCWSGVGNQGQDASRAGQLLQWNATYVCFYISHLISWSLHFIFYPILASSDADEEELYPPVIVKAASDPSQDDAVLESWD